MTTHPESSDVPLPDEDNYPPPPPRPASPTYVERGPKSREAHKRLGRLLR